MPSKKPISNHRSPNQLSRNYSGSSSYYTPEPLVDFIIDGVDWILKTIFKSDEGILNRNLEFVDPAVGDGIFPRRLLQYANWHISDKKILKWIQKPFLSSFFGYDLDPQALKSAKAKVAKAIKDILNKILISKQNSRNILENIKKIPFFTRNTLLHPESVLELTVSLNQPPINDSSSPLIILGNPPYSISSISQSKWIQELIESYKHHLNRKGKKKLVGLKGIQDDYVKFIRWAQWQLIDQKHPGILAFVSNNYFLDGVIFRGMRHSLFHHFDYLYIINLHGDPKRPPTNNEMSPKDENVFEIQTGICIFFAISLSANTSKDLAQAYYAEAIGSKETKLTFLSQSFEQIDFTPITMRQDYELIPITADLHQRQHEYNQFSYFPDIFQEHIIGVQSLHDRLVTHPNRDRLQQILTRFYDGTYQQQEFVDNKLQKWVKYDGVVYHDARDWKIADGLDGSLQTALSNIIQWQWRGWDRWWVSYDEHLMTKGSSGFRLMQCLLPRWQNRAIVVARVSRKASGENSVLMTNTIAESHCVEGGSGIGDYVFPLKIHPHVNQSADWNQPLPPTHSNISADFLKALKKFYPCNPEQVYYYCYAVLWCPTYRNLYQPFLKQSFPRIPFPKSQKIFYSLADLGQELGDLHCLDIPSDELSNWPRSSITTGKIIKPRYYADQQKIYFNSTDQPSSIWIGNITPAMWNFQIGGYRQLYRWLKHRKYVEHKQNSPHTKRYTFTRSIFLNELQDFIRIAYAIKETLHLSSKLESLFISQPKDSWIDNWKY